MSECTVTSGSEAAASFLGRVRSLSAAHLFSHSESDVVGTSSVINYCTLVTQLQAHEIQSTPASITGSMLVYQAAGLQWLLKAHDSGRNVLLADQMGMGKTLQVD